MIEILLFHKCWLPFSLMRHSNICAQQSKRCSNSLEQIYDCFSADKLNEKNFCWCLSLPTTD